jgi:hypothetical protein
LGEQAVGVAGVDGIAADHDTVGVDGDLAIDAFYRCVVAREHDHVRASSPLRSARYDNR